MNTPTFRQMMNLFAPKAATLKESKSGSDYETFIDNPFVDPTTIPDKLKDKVPADFLNNEGTEFYSPEQFRVNINYSVDSDGVLGYEVFFDEDYPIEPGDTNCVSPFRKGDDITEYLSGKQKFDLERELWQMYEDDARSHNDDMRIDRRSDY